jgi:hypothetical protein
MTLVPEIGVLEPTRHSTKACLGEVVLQFREALEDAGQNQLGDADGRPQPEIANPFDLPAVANSAMSPN